MQEHKGHVMPVKSKREYIKFGLVILFILASSTGLTLLRGWEFRLFLNDFMAIFFITFAAFKLHGLEMFVLVYRSYDLLAKKFRPWAYAFPFVEIVLGFSYLLINKNPWLYILTMIITGIATVGVWKELKSKKRRMERVQCACLGNIIKLPLSSVSLFEDVLMFIMAAAMFLL